MHVKFAYFPHIIFRNPALVNLALAALEDLTLAALVDSTLAALVNRTLAALENMTDESDARGLGTLSDSAILELYMTLTIVKRGLTLLSFEHYLALAIILEFDRNLNYKGSVLQPTEHRTLSTWILE